MRWRCVNCKLMGERCARLLGSDSRHFGYVGHVPHLVALTLPKSCSEGFPLHTLPASETSQPVVVTTASVMKSDDQVLCLSPYISSSRVATSPSPLLTPSASTLNPATALDLMFTFSIQRFIASRSNSFVPRSAALSFVSTRSTSNRPSRNAS